MSRQRLTPGAYPANRFYLELDNQPAGWLHSADGGQASTEVVQERVAGGHPVRKHPGHVKFDEISLTCGTGMSKKFYQWLQKSVSYDHERKNGAIVVADYDFKETTTLEFQQGLLTEIGFPALDAASKDPCRLTVKIAPERSKMNFHGRSKSILPINIDAKKQKQWLPNNFRLTIDGLNCKRVNKVDAIVIKQKVIDNAVGEDLVFEKEPAQIDFPNVVLTLPEADSKQWYDWHQKFVIDGNSDPSQEKGGHLEFLTPDLKTVLFTIKFFQLGIIKFTPDKLESGSDKLRMVKIEMYCERMEFEYSSASTWM